MLNNTIKACNLFWINIIIKTQKNEFYFKPQKNCLYALLIIRHGCVQLYNHFRNQYRWILIIKIAR
jgi:hypothetical protein